MEGTKDRQMELSAETALDILKMISQEDVRRMGFD